MRRGIVHGLMGNIESAITDIKKGVELMAGSVTDIDRGKFISPFIELNQFITKNPGDARAYEMRGIFRLLQRKETEAAKDFEKSLELEPTLRREIDRIAKELKSRQ